jgi:hypothetical protein
MPLLESPKRQRPTTANWLLEGYGVRISNQVLIKKVSPSTFTFSTGFSGLREKVPALALSATWSKEDIGNLENLTSLILVVDVPKHWI